MMVGRGDPFRLVYPLKTNMSLKINGWKMYFLLKWPFFGGHVNFPGCIFRLNSLLNSGGGRVEGSS